MLRLRHSLPSIIKHSHLQNNIINRSQLLPLRHFSSSNQQEPVPEIEKCLYKLLGVPKDANTQEIKEAYLGKARQFHPDKNPEALEYFTHIGKAYETLSDPQKRAVYDEESISDEDFFTISLGPVKLNLFTLFLYILALTLCRVACVSSFAYLSYYMLVLRG